MMHVLSILLYSGKGVRASILKISLTKNFLDFYFHNYILQYLCYNAHYNVASCIDHDVAVS